MYIMVRPGLRRLQDAQRVKVQPNKAGTSVNQNKARHQNQKQNQNRN